MSHKYDEPPAYAQSQGGPAPPQAAYQGYGGYGQQQQYGYQQGPPNGGYYQPGPQMGYHQQQPGYGPYQQGPPHGYYQDDRNGGSGCMQALLAGLACCCCLECLLF